MAYVFQDLSKLGRDLKHVLIVDNSPASYSFHPENAVSNDIFLASSYFMEHSALLNTLFSHDGVFSRAGGVVYLEVKNK